MDCIRFQTLQGRRLADALDDAEAREAATHLDGCAACRAREASLRAGLEKFESLPRERPSPEVWERVSRAIDHELAMPRRRRSAAWLWPAVGLATAAAVLAALLWNPWMTAAIRATHVTGVARIGTRPIQAGDRIDPGARIETDPQATVTLSLPSGASVKIGPSTRAEFRADGIELTEGDVEARGVRVRTPEVDVDGAARVDVSRRDGFWTDVRADGEWREYPGDRRAPLADYEALVRDRRAAFEAGERLALCLARVPTVPPEQRRDLMAEIQDAQGFVAQIRREAAHPRVQGALVEGLAAGALSPNGSGVAALRREVAASVEAGRREKLPPDWLLVEADELPPGPLRETITRLKLDLIARLEKHLTPAQVGALRELIEEDDDD